MKIKSAFLSAIITSFIITGCGGDSNSSSTASDLTILKNVTVIDGTNGNPIIDASIIIKDNKIEAIQASSESIDKNATVIDMTGKYVLPGFIDAHIHLAGDEETGDGEQLLDNIFKGGVTTVRDMAGNGTALKTIKTAAESSLVSRPKVYFSALLGGREFLKNDPRVAPTAGSSTIGEVPWMKFYDTDTNVEELVREAKEFGVTGLKFYADISNELLIAATEEAEKQGLETWAHAALFTATPRDVAISGVNSMSHTDMLALTDLETLPKYIDVAEFFMMGGELGNADPNGAENLELYQTLIANDVVLEPTISPFVAREQGVEKAIRYAKSAYENGVMIGVGTDNDGTVLSEMKLLMENLGMSESEVIIAATANNAKSLGMESSIGTVEVGKVADLVVVSKNPLLNIDNLSTVTHVIKEGKIHEISN